MTIKRTVTVLSAAAAAALLIVSCGDFGTNLPFGAGGCPGLAGNLIIANANTIRSCDIDTLAFVSEVTPPAGVTLPAFGGFDDGRHMIVDRRGGRLFITNHDSDFDVYDVCLNAQTVNWGVNLSEPLGLAVLPNGKILVTDEEDFGVTRLTAGLAMDTASTGGGSDYPEGLAYDSVHDRIYIAAEDDYNIDIFDGTTLAYIDSVGMNTTSDAGYWVGVDGSSNRLFVLSDSGTGLWPNTEYGIFVYDISGGGDVLTFNQILHGSGGASQDCFGALTVSEAHDKLFAIDYCNDTVAVFDTTTLAQTGTVPAACTGSDAPTMIAVTE